MTAFSSRAEAIRSRCEAATPGPWDVSRLDDTTIGPRRVVRAHGQDIGQLMGVCRVFERIDESDANTDFIAHARTDLPDALAEIARLTAQVETLQGERDEAVRRIPTEQPDRGGRLVLNAYGRACYDSGRECAEAQVTELQGLLNTATTLAATHFDRANAAEAQVTAQSDVIETQNRALDALANRWLAVRAWAERARAAGNLTYADQLIAELNHLEAADAKVLQRAAQEEVTALRALLRDCEKWIPEYSTLNLRQQIRALLGEK